MKNNQKGFIQLPLLVIAIGVLIVTSTGIGLTLYKQGLVPSLTASVSQLFRGEKPTSNVEIEQE